MQAGRFWNTAYMEFVVVDFVFRFTETLGQFELEHCFGDGPGALLPCL